MNAFNLYLMKQCFDVTHEGYLFRLESTQHPSEIVSEVWTLKKLLTEGEASIDRIKFQLAAKSCGLSQHLCHTKEERTLVM